MKNDNFQIIFIGVFLAAAVFGILVFAGVIPLGGNKANKAGSLGTVVLWGTAKQSDMSAVLEVFNRVNKTFVIKYVQKFPDTFDKELVEALAAGAGPDLFFLPDDLAYSYSKRIVPIPYNTYPISVFKNNFVSAGDVFLTAKNMLAFPIAVDPLVMYYNRSILDANNIVYPPSTWGELVAMTPALTLKDDSNRIIRSAVSMGQFSNVTNAKDVLAALFMQTGNPIVSETQNGFLAVLDKFSSTTIYNPEYALGFYTDFTNPAKEIYSWNRSLADSRDAFSAENLVFYFGHASELQSLINKNPNQNFAVAPLPQIKEMNFKLTSSRVIGIAISAGTKNFTGALAAASLMATGNYSADFAKAMGAIPIRRDYLGSVKPNDIFYPVFYSSALISRSWVDPSPKDTNDIFRKMVDGVLSNVFAVRDSIKDAETKMNFLLAK